MQRRGFLTSFLLPLLPKPKSVHRLEGAKIRFGGAYGKWGDITPTRVIQTVASTTACEMDEINRLTHMYLNQHPEIVDRVFNPIWGGRSFNR